ncbi:MAG: hypothetical protein ABJC26_01895, partial [Gemmatimonadaceae bacterium]
DELVAKFSADGLQKKAAIFDHTKLEWMNGQHLAHDSIESVESFVFPALERAGLTTAAELSARHDWYRALLELLRVRGRTIDELVKLAVPYFRDAVEYEPEAVAKQWKDPATSRDILAAVQTRLQTVSNWDLATLEENLRKLAEELGISTGKIFQPLRVALTGQSASPGIFEVLLYVGRERSLARLSAAVEHLSR